LRDYGTPPQVWGGDPECQHRWGDELKSAQRLRNGDGKSTLTNARRFAPEAKGNHAALHPSQGAFCARCGAWRGSLGLEPTYQLYVDHLVEVLREVRRVLRPDGTLWLNLGDCYATGGGKANKAGGGRQGERWPGVATQPNRMPQPGLKPKDLVGIPWRVAFALQDDGWWLRRDNVWHKPNPMPESTTDRCTSSHEYLFHLTKAARYFYDAEAVKEDAVSDHPAGNKNGFVGRQGGAAFHVKSGGIGNPVAWSDVGGKRNKRSVWTIATSPFPEAHFATFPPALVEPCILAGTSAKGVCPKCGAPWVRVVEKQFRGSYSDHSADLTAGMSQPSPNNLRGNKFYEGYVPPKTIGWRPSCSCNAGDPIPATVLDPFLGAGTTALVADRLGRDCIGIELSPAYAAMAKRRISAPKSTDRAAAKLRSAA
jgi:DNA modification methylase